MKIKSLNESSLPGGWRLEDQYEHNIGRGETEIVHDYVNSNGIPVSIYRFPKSGKISIWADLTYNFESKSPSLYNFDDSAILLALSQGFDRLTKKIVDHVNHLDQKSLLRMIPKDKEKAARKLIFSTIS